MESVETGSKSKHKRHRRTNSNDAVAPQPSQEKFSTEKNWPSDSVVFPKYLPKKKLHPSTHPLPAECSRQRADASLSAASIDALDSLVNSHQMERTLPLRPRESKKHGKLPLENSDKVDVPAEIDKSRDQKKKKRTRDGNSKSLFLFLPLRQRMQLLQRMHQFHLLKVVEQYRQSNRGEESVTAKASPEPEKRGKIQA